MTELKPGSTSPAESRVSNGSLLPQRLGTRRKRASSRWRPGAGRASASALTLLLVGCGSDTGGPDPINVAIRVQPSTVVAGNPIEPAVEITTSSDSRQTVSLSIAERLCGAQLTGQLSRTTIDGVASFPGISIDIPARGYQLQGRVLEQTVTTTEFDVLPPDFEGPLEMHSSLCIRGQSSGDAASLAWDSEDDVLWTTDDNLDRVCGLDPRTGSCLSEITRAEIHEQFPGSESCDDAGGDPGASCSFTDEFETVAWDPGQGRLFVFNTVNDPTAPPTSDRPAVFRFRSAGCRGCLDADGWNPLPAGYSYRAAVVIDGTLYISDGLDLHEYDFDTNSVTEEPVALSFPSIITGLSYDAGELAAVTLARRLITADWEQGRIEETYDLTSIGILSPGGLSIIRDTVHVLDGRAGSPIFRLTRSGESS